MVDGAKVDERYAERWHRSKLFGTVLYGKKT